MNRTGCDIAGRADDLRAVLDEEIAVLDLRRSQLEGLCEAIVERNNDRLERLLNEMEQTEQLQAAVDARLGAVREGLAAALSLAPARLKLSAVIDHLPAARRAELGDRRRRLVKLAQQLREKHLKAAVLVTECARINHLVLQALLPEAETVTTYGADGTDSWRSPAGLMDAEL